MHGRLTLEELAAEVDRGSIHTVMAAIVDMQGRLMGKRFHARHFLDSAHKETHCCNYLLATDLEMYTVQGFAATSWERGYGDYTMRPDLATLRRAAWADGAALVICDVLDHHGEKPVAHSPRQIL
ncbi:MAG: glutamine synthetase, partial [Pseudomonadota bacterium]